MRAICAALLLACSSAHALQARDIDRDGVTDAYFDPLHNQTWLAQASPVAGAASLYWQAYAEVASTYDAAWRLPLLLDTSVPATSCSADWATPQVQCSRPGASEVSRLVAAWGDALPVVSWAGNSGSADFGFAEVALGAILSGSQDVFWGDTYAAYAPFWFLADGDVGNPVAAARFAAQAIPEPQTYAMLALGLLVIAWRSRRAPAS
jgi:hypothetical protein